VLVVHAYKSSLLRRLRSGGSRLEASPGREFEREPISKITRAKWTGGVAQVVERLLCKCEVLSSNSNLTKKKTKKRKKTEHTSHPPQGEDTAGRWPERGPPRLQSATP
jgi:hypothetical protein